MTDGCQAWFDQSVSEPEGWTHVFFHHGNRLHRLKVNTPDHHLAINEVRQAVMTSIKPVLALIEGGKGAH